MLSRQYGSSSIILLKVSIALSTSKIKNFYDIQATYCLLLEYYLEEIYFK